MSQEFLLIICVWICWLKPHATDLSGSNGKRWEAEGVRVHALTG